MVSLPNRRLELNRRDCQRFNAGPLCATRRRCTMVSTWWLMVAFFVGIYAGVSLMALLYLAKRDSDNPGSDFPDVMHP